jgi:hypothetical protein
MDNSATFIELKQIFEKLGIEISEQKLEHDSGKARSSLARVYAKKIFYLDQSLAVAEKIEFLIEALKGFDLSGIYVSPYIRTRVEESNERET